MDLLTQYLPQQVVQALGWTVLNSLWQALVVAALVGLCLYFMRKRPSRERYIVANIGLFATFIWSVFTFVTLLQSKALSPDTVYLYHPQVPTEASLQQEIKSFFTGYFEMHLPLIVAIWLIGEAFFALKLAGGFLYVQRLQYFHSTPLGIEWQVKIKQLSNSLGLNKAVNISESTLVNTPVVLGWLKPIILMPVGAVNNLSIQQVEAILAHELAHIHRHDYILNIVQTLIETLMYFNPAVWWISSQIRIERENSCDDIAVSLVGNSLIYAKALASLQEIQQYAPALVLPFSENKDQMLNRIRRILSQQQNKSNVMEKLFATFILIATVWLLSAKPDTPISSIWNKLLNEKLAEPISDDFKNEIQVSKALVSIDTIPDEKKKEVMTMVKKSGEEEIELSVVNGKIESLKVNGKVIPEAEYPQYQYLLEEVKKDRPAPPAPPAPPTPSAPPAHRERVRVPAPPAPPSPRTESRKITTERDGKKTTIIIESPKEKEPLKIIVEDGKKGSVIINGQEIKELKKGNQTIIIEKSAIESPSRMYYMPFDNREFRWESRPENRFFYRYKIDSGDSIKGTFHFKLDTLNFGPRMGLFLDGKNLEIIKEKMKDDDVNWEEGLFHLDRENIERMREEIRKNTDRIREEQRIIIRENVRSVDELKKEMQELQKERKEEIKKEIEIEKKKEKKKIN